tara:strand:- start:367 stop:942 length:576 start_codon:yes stop_codon:yes gene_type:complete
MIKIGILGDIGSGKTFTANQFGYPVFNADIEVSKIYKNNKRCFQKLKKNFPNHIFSFPLNKKEISKLILLNKKNLKKINKIVHPIVRDRMNKFINKNKKKKIVVLDIPLLLENKIKKKDFILVFVDAKKKEIVKNLKKRKNYNIKIINILKKFQLPLKIKKKKSDYIIKNDFREKSVKKNVRILKNKILYK